jgi:hypothetical protein
MGFGNLATPYVENPYAGWIINVHWHSPGSHVIGGTCSGAFGLSTGLGSFSALLGICNGETGEVFVTESVSLGAGERATVTLSASGSLANGEGVALTPYFNVTAGTGFGISGIFYAGNGSFSLIGSAVSNSGDLSPFGQFVNVSGPGNWTCSMTFKPYAGPPFTSGIPGTISVVLSPP